ncbi:MAG: hypothetical protein RL150_398 [Candidatus Parcubacteria bacterium]|jgi:methionine-rich copper-binding protein CopC
MLRPLQKNKKLLLITVLVFLFGFAGVVRAAYYYSCNGGGAQNFPHNITWYSDSLCQFLKQSSPNFDGTSNSVTITNTNTTSFTVLAETITLGVDDTVTLGGGSYDSELRIDGGGLIIDGGTLTLSDSYAVLKVVSGILRLNSGSISVASGARVENSNSTGLDLSFDNRSVLQNTVPSLDNNTNVLTLAGGSSYSVSGINFSAGEATFTVDGGEGLLVVNGTNDVDTQVAGTLNVIRANGLGSLSQTFSFNFTDTTDPNVLTVSATADTYGPGDIIAIEVLFDDEATYVGGTDLALQRLYLSNGAYAEYSSGNSSDTHVYEYTVQASDASTNSLEVVGFTDGDTKSISDSTDNWIYIKDLVFPSVGSGGSLSGVMIDTEVPLNSKAPAHETTGVPVDTNITLTFAENVSTVEGLTVTLLDQSSFVPVDLVYNVGLDPEISNFGGVVTINPENDLLGGTTYSVVVQQGAFQDALGNEFVGISENEWVFTTVVPDTTPPTIQTLTPDDDATEVAAGSTFSIVFDEGIQLGAGSIRVYQAAGPTLVDTIPAAETTITGGSTVEFTITGLQSEQLYYIQIDNNAFTDPSGNAFAGILNDTTWSFTTEDTVAPTVSSLSPTDNGVNFPPDGNLVISFDDDISLALGSGTLLTIYNAATDSTFETVNVNGSNVSIDGRDLIFNPTATLISGESYYVQITNNSVLDDGDNYYAGIADETTWNFTVDPKPTVSSFSPADDSVGIDLYANLVLTFSEGVSIGTGNIVIKKVSDNTTVETISVSSGQVTGGGTTEIMINPSVTLEDNTEYYIQIDEGAFIDGFSQSYAGILDDTTWTFTTIALDSSPPTVVELTPGDNEIEVATDETFIIEFTETVQAGAGNIYLYFQNGTLADTLAANELSYSGANASFTFNDWQDNASYYILIDDGAITDTNGNSFEGISNNTAWSFSTIDTQGPTVSAVSPADNATDVAVDANLVITFNENVSTGVGTNIRIYNAADDSLFEEIQAGAQLAVSGGTVTVNPAASFTAGASYYVQISSSSFSDAVDNHYAGIADETTWNFTVIDATDPGASGGGGGGSVYGDKPAKPSMSVRVLGGERVEISGTHQGDSESPTATFGYTYKAKTGKTKTVLLNRNVTDTVSFVEVLDGLTCGETYLVRVFAKNRAGTSATVAEVTTAACDGSTEGEVVSTDSDETDPSVIADEAQAVQTAEAYQAVQDVVCSIFTTPTAPGESNADVPRIKLFLNFLFPGLNLDVTSLVYDDATVAATKRFQMQYADMILKPLGLTQATGFWYQATMRQAHKVLGCDR